MVPRLDQRIPFPEPVNRDRGRDVLFRAATASFISSVSKGSAIALTHDDLPVNTLLRATTNPATLGTSSWAGALAATAVDDTIVGLAGPSAAAELIQRGLRVDLSGYGAIQVPGRIVDPADAGAFVLEGAPIPASQLPLDAGPLLAPFKFAVMASFTNELAEHSNAERVVRQILSEAAALRLDAELFSTTAASTSRPAGLLNNVVALAAASAGDGAMMADIGSLVGALATAGGGSNVIFVCSPPQAAALKLRAGTKFDYPILSSAALTAGSIVAIEAGSFVSGFGPVPEFAVSDQAVLHESTVPAALGMVGTPAVVAAPARSMWQTNSTALRMILRCSWAMRATGHIQVINSVTW
jgi:hypothetical protein